MDAAQRRAIEVWDWLPVFRAVAETEHLPTAAKRLGLTVSAVSRTVGVLEQQLGRSLFDRVGRTLRLNADGHAMLAGVREAMRRMDEALLDVAGERFFGPLRLSATAHLAVAWLAPAIEQALRAHPRLRPELLFVPPREVPRALLEGRIDLALTTELVPSDAVRSIALGAEGHAVYCGRGHPLWGRGDVTLEEVQSFPFCGPPPDPAGIVRDGWPIELSRTVVLHVAQMAVGVGVCERGGLLAVLPAVWAERTPETLWRLPVDVVAEKTVFALVRSSIYQPGPAEWVLERLLEVRRRAPE